MPIEIKELIIKTTVNTAPGEERGSGSLRPEDLQTIKEEIKKECLEWIQEYLRKRESR